MAQQFDTRIIFDEDFLLLGLNQLVYQEVGKIFCVYDTNTYLHYHQQMQQIVGVDALHSTILSPGESNKTLSSVELLWQAFADANLDRLSTVLVIGGGLLCDVAAFATSTYKRGMKLILVPTSLLAMVDASIGGKTGFNLNGIKNQIGTVSPADTVYINPVFLRTLNQVEIDSAYAEIIKYGLISTPQIWHDVKAEEFKVPSLNLIKQCVEIKKDICAKDLNEKGDRKKLNFGHTIGHALESIMQGKGQPISHGHAVALGMVLAINISQKLCGFSLKNVNDIQDFILTRYSKISLNSEDYESVVKLVLQDKKTVNNALKMILLTEIGNALIDQPVSLDMIKDSLKIVAV